VYVYSDETDLTALHEGVDAARELFAIR
jgi:hypothetical protein